MTDLQRRIAALSPRQREQLEQRLAEKAAARGPGPEDRITPRDRSRPTPLAFQQEREWAISRFRSVNNIPGAFRVEGALDPALISRILTEIVERHEVLRSTVELQADGSRVQVVHPATPVPTPVVDLSHLSPEDQRSEVHRRWLAEVAGPFDADQPLRLRTSLLRVAQDNHVVLITTDHCAADLVSVAILLREFAALYAIHGEHDGEGDHGLPPLEIQYGDFAAWQREFGEERLAAEVEHWRRTLDGIPGELTLPSDRPFPARPTFAGAVHDVHLPPGFAGELRAFTEREKATLGAVLLAALSVLLYRYLEQDDLVIGELASGRSRAETDRVIGCFVTALPLRMRMSDEQTLREVVAQARHTVFTAYDHQDLPIDRLIDQLGLGREASQTSMSHMWLDVRTPENSLTVPGLRISQEPIEASLAAAPLTLDVNDTGDTLRLQWIYMTEMFDAGTVVLLAEQFNTVLRQFVSVPDTTVGQVELAVVAASPVRQAEAAAPGFVELFQRRVALAPHAPAVIRDGVPTSYGELNRAANRVAHHLRGVGVGRETPVGILVDRSPALASAILGVLKAGGVYVPLDPAYPPERMAFMLADAGARVLLTQEDLLASLADAGAVLPDVTVLLDGPTPLVETDTDLPDTPDPASLAYVVYTSGSTGRPKGAMIEHRSLVTFARDVVDRLGLGAGDRFLQFASPSFDVLVEELFPTWLAGGAVVIPTQHLISGGGDLGELIERERLTVIELPTAYWHEWVRELDRLGRDLAGSLRLVIIGGERVLPDRLAMWRRLGVPLAHVYGLTETTVSSTFFRLDPADPCTEWPNLPIGTPLPSADLRVLDRRLRPVPVGGTGELYIGGVSLARGYLGRPGLTAHRFIADPDPAGPGQRLYRTGDLVRRRVDGNLEFIDRVDTQIKIRGFRVEPMEIESTLSRHEQVAESVVTRYEPVPGDRRLVAYVVPYPDAELSVGELRRFLERELPAYMVPSAFVELAALPLTPNGKVDRDRLPDPDGDRLAAAEEYVAPESPVQEQLADVVAAVVGVTRVGIHDNFFEVGGDSILAIQVVARAQEVGLRLTPYDLFAHPTVAALAEVAAAGPTIDAEQGDVTGPVPLAPTQREFCVAGVEEPHHWNNSVLLELAAPGEPDLLRAAVEHLMAHHDGLRQRFLLSGERTRVRIAPRGDATPFETYNLCDFDYGEQNSRMRELFAGLQTSLDLAVGPLMRVALVKLGGRRPDRLAVVVHRLVADAESMRILLEDLRTALAGGAQVRLPAKTTAWQSWVRRLTRHAGTPPVRAEREFWSALVTAPAASLPSDTPAEPAADTVASARTVSVALDAAATGKLLTAVPEALNCRIEELLLTAVGRTLTGWTGEARHLVDLERHEREPVFEDVSLTRTVGRFSTTHPVALTCDPGGAAEADLKTVKEALRGVPSGGIGWQLLRQGSDPLPDAPVELAFSYLGQVDVPGPGGGFTVTAEPVGADESPRGRRRYAIEVEASVAGGELTIRWRYGERRHRRETVRSLADRCLDELRVLIELSDRMAGSLHTPSDFPLARVDQAQLDDLLSRL